MLVDFAPPGQRPGRMPRALSHVPTHHTAAAECVAVVGALGVDRGQGVAVEAEGHATNFALGHGQWSGRVPVPICTSQSTTLPLPSSLLLERWAKPAARMLPSELKATLVTSPSSACKNEMIPGRVLKARKRLFRASVVPSFLTTPTASTARRNAESRCSPRSASESAASLRDSAILNWSSALFRASIASFLLLVAALAATLASCALYSPTAPASRKRRRTGRRRRRRRGTCGQSFF